MAEKAQITFHIEGFQEKHWSNPSNTSSRLYIHKVEGNLKIECGYLDLNTLTYRGPDKRRKHADHNIVICENDKQAKGLVLIATVVEGKTKVDLHYKNEGGELKETPPQEVDSQSEKIPEPVVDIANEKDVENSESLSLSHIASITQSKSKITISYANTVEVKSRGRVIGTQYPKFSLQVEMEGGDVVGHINEAADEVVRLVEERLTSIVNEMTDKN
jgi:hypothetical protein